MKDSEKEHLFFFLDSDWTRIPQKWNGLNIMPSWGKEKQNLNTKHQDMILNLEKFSLKRGAMETNNYKIV